MSEQNNKQSIGQLLEPGMIIGFTLGGLYCIIRTIYETVCFIHEFGWIDFLLPFSVGGILLGLFFLGLVGIWLEDREGRIASKCKDGE